MSGSEDFGQDEGMGIKSRREESDAPKINISGFIFLPHLYPPPQNDSFSSITDTSVLRTDLILL